MLPFRWVEIEGWPGELSPEQIVRQAAFATTWDDDAASFESSDEMLNRIWELCRYSIKATTFAGVYVDGDRERIPYEADAYLNQLSHYATDNDVQMARDTFDWLMKHRHLADRVGAAHGLHGPCRLDAHRRRPSGWRRATRRSRPSCCWTAPGRTAWSAATSSRSRRTDIVDWPKGERDGYVFTPVNTVVNAFHLARHGADGGTGAGRWKATPTRSSSKPDARATRAAFQEKLLRCRARALSRWRRHRSRFAAREPVSAGLRSGAGRAPRRSCRDWLAKRGMACSVYAAQYLLEGLVRER